MNYDLSIINSNAHTQSGRIANPSKQEYFFSRNRVFLQKSVVFVK